MINLQSKVICNKIHGRREHLIASFLMGIHIGKRKIWLCRAGHTDEVDDLDLKLKQSEQKDRNPIIEMLKHKVALPSAQTRGSHLSAQGHEFAKKLAEFVHSNAEGIGSIASNDVFARYGCVH